MLQDFEAAPAHTFIEQLQKGLGEHTNLEFPNWPGSDASSELQAVGNVHN